MHASGGQHQVRIGGGDGLEVGASEVADLGDVGHLGRVVVVGGHADHAVAGADREQDLGVGGRERDDACGLLLDGDRAAGVVGDGDREGRLRLGGDLFRRLGGRLAARAGGERFYREQRRQRSGDESEPRWCGIRFSFRFDAPAP